MFEACTFPSTRPDAPYTWQVDPILQELCSPIKIQSAEKKMFHLVYFQHIAN